MVVRAVINRACAVDIKCASIFLDNSSSYWLDGMASKTCLISGCTTSLAGNGIVYQKTQREMYASFGLLPLFIQRFFCNQQYLKKNYNVATKSIHFYRFIDMLLNC